MPRKKVKIKKPQKLGLIKIWKQFFNSNFFEGIVSLRQVCFFLNQHKILNFLIPYMTYFKKKNVHLSEGPILKCIHTKTKKKNRNTTK
jgi:hypothetical protein